jgi:glycine/D-amino acid oxidase-like deaminating enzyme
MKQNVDFLIVGQGIAGSVLTFQLLQKGVSFHVVDEIQPMSSSIVAGGLINPITGRKMLKSWMFDQLIDSAYPFYRSFEKFLNQTFLHEMPIHRILNNTAEINDWEAKRGEDAYAAYMSGVIQNINPALKAPFGYGVIQKGGWINSKLIVNEFRNYLIGNNLLTASGFNYEDLQVNEWKEISFQHIIFCEGYKGSNNPYFPGLALAGAKGEVMHVQAPKLNSKEIINKNMLLIPLGNDAYKVGATFEHNAMEGISEKGKTELVEKFETVTDVPFNITLHLAGIRPTAKDRRPLLGRSTIHDNYYIFNGLGTKGISLAPFFAQHLIDFILSHQPLMKEVNWTRFIR